MLRTCEILLLDVLHSFPVFLDKVVLVLLSLLVAPGPGAAAIVPAVRTVLVVLASYHQQYVPVASRS